MICNKNIFLFEGHASKLDKTIPKIRSCLANNYIQICNHIKLIFLNDKYISKKYNLSLFYLFYFKARTSNVNRYHLFPLKSFRDNFVKQ